MSREIPSEIASLENRLSGLKIVMSGKSDELKAYIAKFSSSGSASSNVAPSPTKSAGGRDPASSPTKSAGGRSAIGNAAPTPTYKDLHLFAEMEVASQDFRDASQVEDMTAVVKRVNDIKKPIKDLEAACREATKEFSNAREFVMKPKGKAKAKGKGKGKAGRGKAGKGSDGGGVASAPVGSAFVEAASEHGKAIEFPLLELGASSLAAGEYMRMPCVVSSTKVHKEISAVAEVKSLVDSFVTEFAASELRTSKGAASNV